MPTHSSLMFAEAQSAAGLLAAQRTRNAETLARLANSLRGTPPRFIVTLARGSSDNAATYARYLIERRLGLLTGSLSPSVSSVYDAPLEFTGGLMIAISQSGRSPDIIGTARKARERGARVVALVNDSASPLAREADFFIDIAAGAEQSVAATKTFTLSLAAILDLISHWSEDSELAAQLDQLPALLAASWNLDWSGALAHMVGATSMFVVARGQAFGVAQELALKLKETCSIHAEAISAAEVRHGPMALVAANFPVLFVGQPDETLPDTAALARTFALRGARVIQTGLGAVPGISLPHIEADPVVLPLLQLQSFYRLCEMLSRVRGLDPDNPPHLKKVTQTL